MCISSKFRKYPGPTTATTRAKYFYKIPHIHMWKKMAASRGSRRKLKIRQKVPQITTYAKIDSETSDAGRPSARIVAYTYKLPHMYMRRNLMGT